MQKIKFIGYSNTLFQNKILEETIFYFANKSGFKIEKLEYNFVDLNAMRSLNVDFLSHDNHTDIVTFDYSEEKNLIAEVYISLSMMRENAKKYKQSIDNECVRLISHGLFHCLGYKDKTSGEKAVMRKKEEEFIFAVSRETNQNV
jgi:rRNA maturation RNase YbeY|tara:strand:+ start:28 stop:462 length:435 start_codon:yes stop_codon:yes gene_type:complete